MLIGIAVIILLTNLHKHAHFLSFVIGFVDLFFCQKNKPLLRLIVLKYINLFRSLFMTTLIFYPCYFLKSDKLIIDLCSKIKL